MLLLQTLLVWNFSSLDAGEEQRGGREKRDRGGEQRGQPQRRGPAAPHGKALVGGERERRCLSASGGTSAGTAARATRGSRPGARVPVPAWAPPQVPRCGAGPAPVRRERPGGRGAEAENASVGSSPFPGRGISRPTARAACRGHPSIPELRGRAACPTPSWGFVLVLLCFSHPVKRIGAVLYCTALTGPGGDGQ